jgi:hypothetical protein
VAQWPSRGSSRSLLVSLPFPVCCLLVLYLFFAFSLLRCCRRLSPRSCGYIGWGALRRARLATLHALLSLYRCYRLVSESFSLLAAARDDYIGPASHAWNLGSPCAIPGF